MDKHSSLFSELSLTKAKKFNNLENRVDAENLKKLIEIKEKRLKVVNEQLSHHNGTLVVSSSR
jgi:hypothetical protein